MAKRRRRAETVIGEDGLGVMILLGQAKVDLPVKAKQLVRQWVARERPFAKEAEQALALSDVIVLRVPDPARESVAEAEAYAADRDRLIASDPRIFGGQPVIVGTRIPVHTVAQRLEAGDTLDVLAEDYPHVERRAFEVAALYARTRPSGEAVAERATRLTSGREAVRRREPLAPARLRRSRPRLRRHVCPRPRPAGAPDAQILAFCVGEDRVCATNNAGDFRELVGEVELHPGLVVGRYELCELPAVT